MWNIVFVAGALVVSVVLQAVWWRVRVPKRQIISLLLLYPLVFLVATLPGLYWGILDVGLADYARLSLLFVSIVLTYATIFSAVEVRSPTLSIVSYIADGGPQGRPQDELTRRFVGEGGMMERLELMELSGLIRIDNGRCELTEKGFLFARLFQFGATFFGLTQGG